MNDVLANKIEHLEQTIKELRTPVWSKFNLGTVITIIVLSVGLVGSWYTTKAEVAGLKEDLAKVEIIQDKQDISVQDIKIKSVQDSADIKHIKEKVTIMDQKLDKLLDVR